MLDTIKGSELAEAISHQLEGHKICPYCHKCATCTKVAEGFEGKKHRWHSGGFRCNDQFDAEEAIENNWRRLLVKDRPWWYNRTV